MAYIFVKGSVNGTRSVSRSIHAKGRIAFFTKALELYKQDFDAYPSEEAGLHALIENNKQKNYMSRSSVPKDPWGHTYIYTSPGADGRGFEIVSYGADAAQGGTGEDADVSCRQQFN